jgi:hypothetical protein
MHRYTPFIPLLGAMLFSAATHVRADDPVNTAPAPPPSEEQENIEPEVKIIQREDKTIEEYRVNGRLYKIKITPKNAPPYYLVDSNGDGNFESRRAADGPEPDLMIPQWVLFRW